MEKEGGWEQPGLLQYCSELAHQTTLAHACVHTCLQEHATSYMLRCNIGSSTNHLHEGIALGLRDDREKMSEKVGRTCLWKGTSCITRLPRCVPRMCVRAHAWVCVCRVGVGSLFGKGMKLLVCAPVHPCMHVPIQLAVHAVITVARLASPGCANIT